MVELAAQDTETRRPGLPRTLLTLTSLRFFAAFAVFAHHFTGTGGGTGTGRAPLVFPESQLGGNGVTFFFVLSGFVLTWAFRPREHPMSFYWRRVGRIWPAHLAATVFALAVIYYVGSGVPDWPSFFSSVLLVQGWFENVDPTLPGNGVTWTLSVEVLFYALFPVVARFADRVRTAVLLWATVVGLAAMYAFTWWARTHLDASTAAWTLRHPVFYLPEFLAGVTLAMAVRRGWRWGLHPIVPAVGFAAFAYVLYDGAPRVSEELATQVGYLLHPILTLLSGLVILGCTVREIQGRPGLLAHPVLVAFGTWSYSFFLLHQPVRRLHLHEWGRVDNDNNALLVMAGLAAIVLALSWALYTFVEHPAELWMRQHVPRRWRERRDGQPEPEGQPGQDGQGQPSTTSRRVSTPRP